MASGKALGEFSFKAVTIKIQSGTGGRCPRGDELGKGRRRDLEQSLARGTYVGGPKERNFQFVFAAYLDNGDGLTGLGQGTYESTGKHRWRTENFMQISDGRRIRGEGEMDLAARSWKGTIFEMS